MAPRNPDRHVLDACAVLAYLRREPGYQRVSQALASGAVASTVNLAEVYGKVRQRGFPIEPLALRLAALGLATEPFSEEDSRRCGELALATASIDLSLQAV